MRIIGCAEAKQLPASTYHDSSQPPCVDSLSPVLRTPVTLFQGSIIGFSGLHLLLGKHYQCK